MAKKKKKQECPPGSPMWMSTFTDMNMLLLTFFILLLSMSSMDDRKIKEALGSLQGALGVLKEGSKTEMTKDDIMSRLSFVENVKNIHSRMSANLKSYMQQANMAKVVSVVQTDKGVSIRILDSVVFDRGSAQLKDGIKPVLERLTAMIQESPYNVLVEGHTDDAPVNSQEFETNWELSTARAVSVVKYFINNGLEPQRLTASGFAEYHPILPNITPENRAKNRRVEINLISPEFSESNKNYFEEDEGGF